VGTACLLAHVGVPLIDTTSFGAMATRGLPDAQQADVVGGTRFVADPSVGDVGFCIGALSISRRSRRQSHDQQIGHDGSLSRGRIALTRRR
jgi:hypothetical protein